MKRLLPALFLFYFLARPTLAVELTISNPSVNGTLIEVETYLQASSDYYLQAALKHEGSTYYFGQTKNNSDSWIDYIGNPEKEYITSNFFQTDI